MPIKRENIIKVLFTLGTIAFLFYIVSDGHQYNKDSQKKFFQNDVNGYIVDVRESSGGYKTIRLNSGKEFRFFVRQLGDSVEVGDSISKQAFRDTIILYRNKRMIVFRLDTSVPRGL